MKRFPSVRMGFVLGLAWLVLTLVPGAQSRERAADSDEGESIGDFEDVVSTSGMKCAGRFVQGGFAICRARPGATVRVRDGQTVADSAGVSVIGFDRDAPLREVVRWEHSSGARGEIVIPVAAREYAISRIDGLPAEQVTPRTRSQLARIESSSARKALGDTSRSARSDFTGGFRPPLASLRVTSGFGAQRILNGEAKRPHFGVDFAAPLGTEIVAPAAGIVTLADDDLYFEGAMIVIDHGQGLLSKYLHVSAIDVKVGQVVQAGERIGRVGSRGRSTGPHLCWRLKWRDRNLDPTLWLAERQFECSEAAFVQGDRACGR